jgi:hypothetical protein
MLILTQFLFRLSFGLSLSMAVTPPSKVTSGYYRNHLYVLLGLNVLAVLVAIAEPSRFQLWPPLAAACLSYAGAVAWLYEKRRAGIMILAAVAITTLVGAWLATPGLFENSGALPTALRGHDAEIGVASHALTALRLLDPLTAGLFLGSTMAAMFLGHWYLNTPTMELAPLRRLVLLVGAAVIARAVVCAAGLALQTSLVGAPPLPFVVLRWLAGLIGALALVVMTWKTLNIPNTQSATGILYVGVIAAFLGELTSQLLSAGTVFPV